jgi:hypothetical protein
MPMLNRQPSVLQIRLRSIVLFTVAAAIGCAAMAPQFRQWEPVQQWHFLKAIAGIISIGIVVALVFCGLRLRAERVSQPVFSILAPYAGYYRPWISFSMGIMWFGLLILYFLLFMVTHLTAVTSYQPQFIRFTIPAFGAIYATVAFIQYWWGYRNRLIEFGLHGIIRQGIVSRSWSSVRNVEWNPTTGELKGNFGFFPRMPLEVPPEYREQLNQILHANNLLKPTQDVVR